MSKPETLEAFKKLAKTYRKKHGVTLSAAQAAVSLQYGWGSFYEARNSLLSVVEESYHDLEVEHTWHPEGLVSQLNNVITAHVNLKTKASELIPKKYRAASMLNLTSKVEGKEEFRFKKPNFNETDCFREIWEICRTFQFCDATGFLPTTGTAREVSNVYRPWSDHEREFLDPVSGEVIYIDNPYPSLWASTKTHKSLYERKHGVTCYKLDWASLYHPRAVMVITTKMDFEDLRSRLTSINALRHHHELIQFDYT